LSVSRGDGQQLAKLSCGGKSVCLYAVLREILLPRGFRIERIFLPEMIQDVVEHDEPAADFRCALCAAVLRILLPYYPVKPPGIELIEKRARITLDFSNVSSAFCLRQ